MFSICRRRYWRGSLLDFRLPGQVGQGAGIAGAGGVQEGSEEPELFGARSRPVPVGAKPNPGPADQLTSGGLGQRQHVAEVAVRVAERFAQDESGLFARSESLDQ
jgi:hypothetical protein